MSVIPPIFRPRRALSLQVRITGAAMLTSAVVLLAACAAFIVVQYRTECAELMGRQRALTQIMATGPTIRAVYDDSSAVNDILARARIFLPATDAVYVYDREGRLVARAGRPSPPPGGRGDGMTVVRQAVQVRGETLGVLATYATSTKFWPMVLRCLNMAAALFVAAAGLSLLVGRWLAGRVTEPVERLSQAMREVAASGDFSARVERTADDELGRLTDAFNTLLGRLDLKSGELSLSMAELVAARDAAEAATKLKSQFLANMSHEIRTPLNGLLAMTQVMALEDLCPVQRERLDIIRNSGQALLTILNDVLDVSKIEAGKLELEIGEFDAAAVAHDAHAAFTPVADRKGLVLALEVDDDARGLRAGDAQRLRQIINNLVANALKFTPQGEVRVRLSGEGPDGADGLRLSVSDSGIGIAAETVPLLFQKFIQADASTTRRFGGTGLGLAICHDLAELMGGRIWCESVEGQGSTFHLVLPLRRVGSASAPAQKPAPAPATGDERGLRVLAAEDNATNQLVLRTIMGIFGVELTVVDNGRRAVEAWAGGGYDLILMDIQMPEMDGIAATRLIRAREAETGAAPIPIIALSANAMTHQVNEYLALGFDLHVPKPIELPRLQAALDQAMARADAAGGGSPQARRDRVMV